MVEMLITMTILVVVLGGLTLTYSHVTYRTGTAIATATVEWQVKSFSKYIEDSIKNAVSCSVTVNGTATALKCQMPENGSTTDAFGVYNSFTPKTCTGSGITHWGTGGMRRLFFWSDSTGSFVGGLTPTTIWMAQKSSDSLPGLSDNITGFTYYGGSSSSPLRWKYIDTFTFSVDTTNHTVTYTVGASLDQTTDKTNTSPTTMQQRNVRNLSITRTVCWRRQT